MRRELCGLILVFLALFFLLSLVTYFPDDPSFNQLNAAKVVKNGAGVVGAHIAGGLVDVFGVGAYIWPVFFLVLGLKQFIRALDIAWWRWCGLFLAGFCLMSWSAEPWPFDSFALGEARGGGLVGREAHRLGVAFLRPWGAFLLWAFLSLVAFQLLVGATWTAVGEKLALQARLVWAKLKVAIAALVERLRHGVLVEPDPHGEGEGGLALGIGFQDSPREAETARAVVPDTDQAAPSSGLTLSVRRKRAPKRLPETPRAPSLELLTETPEQADKTPAEFLKAQADKLTACLADFGVQGEVLNITPGPVVTMFEFRPAPGIKISKIAGLSGDLALSLKAMAVRIEAPIPGKDLVGIEIPSRTRQTVYLREILESPTFQKSKSLLTLALGKDIAGQARIADLAKMPHLLVAGATGAGKSVCLNSILLSFLYKALPSEVKLLLIDPKRIELSVYADLPHLVHPVVTEMTEAKNALDWAVFEMDRRYEAMAKLGVRNLDGYNLKVTQKQPKFDHQGEDELAGLEPMPYLVIVIDELADLMMTAAKEVEMSVVRLAQLARAAGIHMILATQRPSVDVVTGLIKANFPCRISFQVTSKHDSRTILDTVGAEHLLGKGDMLFKLSGGKLQRLHGAFVSDEDVVEVVDFWREQEKPEYTMDFAAWQSERQEENGLGNSPGDLNDDPVYDEAVEFVLAQGKASISLLQRRFRIGFNRSARFIEQMETDGIIGPADGSKPRIVLRGRE